jgi:hypothetical protein
MICRNELRMICTPAARFGTRVQVNTKTLKNIFFVRPYQKIQVERLGFFHLCPQDTTSFAWNTQHHLSVGSTSFRGRRTQMNDVALRANDVLRNDVGFAQ